MASHVGKRRNSKSKRTSVVRSKASGRKSATRYSAVSAASPSSKVKDREARIRIGATFDVAAFEATAAATAVATSKEWAKPY